MKTYNKFNCKSVYGLAAAFSLGILLVKYMYGYNAEAGKLTYRRKEHVYQFSNDYHYYVLPGDSIIDEMDDKALYLTFARYVNQKQILCRNVSRAGSTGSFGKNICLDNLKTIQNDCLVYSFGSQFQFDFETAIYKSHQCEIHTFDPSLSVEGKQIPDGVNFHLIGLSNNDESISTPKNLHFESEKIWKMRTLTTIRKSLDHSERIIDILKIDIEGWEWNALPQMLQSGVFDNVKQLCLEVHYGYSLTYTFRNKRMVGYNFSTNTWGNVSIHNQLKSLKKLHDYGFRIFMVDPIKKWALWPVQKSIEYVNTLTEISLVNLNVF